MQLKIWIARGILVSCLVGWSGPMLAEDAASTEEAPGVLDAVVVSAGRETNLVGSAVSASEGVVGQEEIGLRALLRTGEVMELVPGMVATQHSGSGKANQYFLRGFNLDHGTDFATFVDFMPVNMRTHGHGQGYTDPNFIIPELIDSLTYRKGPYYAQVGDFSSAGSAHIRTQDGRKNNLAQLGVGEDNFARMLLAGSSGESDNRWTWGLEAQGYNGPWTDIEEDLKRYNGLLTWSNTLGDGRFAATLMSYDASWNSADQIPLRAVQSGLIDELGSIDLDGGGESSRQSLSANWISDDWTVAGYVIDYGLNLWSDFTYFLDDPVNGDEFEQVDDRTIWGGEASRRFQQNLAGKNAILTIGTELRVDDISEVGLYHSAGRERLGVIRSDSVMESSIGVYLNHELHWTESLRSVLGVRYDAYRFDVNSRVGVNVNGVDLSPNSAKVDDGLGSVKGSLIYSASVNTEYYLSAGQGLHSNDARGVTAKVDPGDGSAVTAADPLVHSLGAEVGARTFITDSLNASLSLWQLDLDSELVFIGDAGNTEAGRSSRRQGAELTLYYRVNDTWTLDAEYAYTDAKFTEDDPTDPSLGDTIPGAIPEVLQLGASWHSTAGWIGSLRLRHFGERPLDENDEIHSDPSTVVNLMAGREWDELALRLEVFNVLDSDDHDIDYWYESQLASESAPVEDLHYHVMEPRTARIVTEWHW